MAAANEFFDAWGATGNVAEATRLVDICLEAGVNLFDTADIYSDGRSEEVLGKALEGRRDQVLISTKATFRLGEGPNDVGSSRYHLRRAMEGSLRRLGTDYMDIYHLHGFDALTPVEEVHGHAEQLCPRGQGALHRLLEFFRLAPDEVAGRGRSLRLDALCGAPGVLLAGRARLRVGADAAGARSEGRRAGVESAGMGAAHGQDSPRPADAGGEPPAQDRPIWGRTVADEYLYKVVDALDAVAAETGKTVPQIALNWLLQRPTVSSVIVGARNEEQLRQNLGAVGWNLTAEQVAALDKASARDAGLSLLASARIYGAQSAAGVRGSGD